MTREERFIEILGGMDEMLVAETMPSYRNEKYKADKKSMIEIIPEKPDKKAVRRYWLTRIAAGAAALIVLAFAVPLVCSILEEQYQKTYIDAPGSGHYSDLPDSLNPDFDPAKFPDISEAYGRTISFSNADVTLTDIKYENGMLISTFDVLYKGNETTYSPRVWIGISLTDTDETDYNYTSDDGRHFVYTAYESAELTEGSSYALSIAYFGYSSIGEYDTQRYSFTCPRMTAVTTDEAVTEHEIQQDTFTYDRPAGSWFELEETLYHIDDTAPFDCVTFDENGNAKSIFIDEWKEEYDAIGYESELESINADNYVGAYDNYGIDVKMIENADHDGYVKRLYSSNYQDADKGEALAMRHKYIVSQLNEKQLKIIDKYMRDKLTVPYESIEWNKVYGVYYVETNKRCELMPDRYYSAVDEDTRHKLFEAMYEADRISEIDGNPGSTYYHTNPLPIAGSDEYIAFWVSGAYKAKIIVTYIIGKDFEGQYKAEQKTDIADELDRLYLDGAKLMFVKSGGGYYAVTESNRKIELIPGAETTVPDYDPLQAYRIKPYLPLPDGVVEDITLGDEQKAFLIKEAYESAQSFERDIPYDRLAVSDPVKCTEQQFFVFVFDGDEIVGKIYCYSDEGFSGSASGFNTGNYDKAVDGLTELYKSGEKVSFKWFGGNLYCCPENAASYPIEWQVFHKPSVVYLYDTENGVQIVRNETE